MKVLQILEESVYGGPHKRTVLISDFLRSSNCERDMQVLAPTNSDRLFYECDKHKVPYVSCDICALSSSPTHLLKYVVKFPFDVWNVLTEFRKNKPDLVHVCGGAWSFKGPIAARLTGIPFVWHMNDAYQPEFVLKLLKVLVKILRPAGVVYSGGRSKKYYEGYFPENLPSTIVRPPISMSYGDGYAMRTLSNTFCGEQVKITMVANINPVKGIDVAIQAVELLSHKGYPVEFLIIGETKSSQNRYRRRIERRYDSLFRHGVVSIRDGVSDVRPFLDESDITLCASITESGPMSVWEYAAMGCVIASSDVGDVKSVLGGDSCHIFSVGSVDELVATIEHILANKDVALQMALLAKERSRNLRVCESARSASQLYGATVGTI